ncbi:hypothetical protein C4513_07125 [Morganella morganii]|nr:hypothetical protein [Morganella morganii]
MYKSITFIIVLIFLFFIKILSRFFILYLMMSGSPVLIFKYSTGGRFLYQLISVLLKSGGVCTF